MIYLSKRTGALRVWASSLDNSDLLSTHSILKANKSASPNQFLFLEL